MHVTRAFLASAVVCAALCLVGFASSAHAEALLEGLWEPGTVLLLRHALAPGTGDPPGFRTGDCATQRNLSDAGRDQARALGERMRDAGLDGARLFSSQWCRCLDTARLLDIGDVQPNAAFNSFFLSPGEEDARTREALEFLRTLTPGPPVVIVTHQSNIRALTGAHTGSAAGWLVRLTEDGRLETLGGYR
jgi:phosphohistidine phosphatase SixA